MDRVGQLDWNFGGRHPGRFNSLYLWKLFCLGNESALIIMAAQTLYTNSSLLIHFNSKSPPISIGNFGRFAPPRAGRKLSVQCSENQTQILRTCKNCKTQFDPLLNNPRACRFHTAHFGGSLSLSLWNWTWLSIVCTFTWVFVAFVALPFIPPFFSTVDLSHPSFWFREGVFSWFCLFSSGI